MIRMMPRATSAGLSRYFFGLDMGHRNRTAWLGMSDSNRRISPRATLLDLRDNFAEVSASPAAETSRVRAA